MVSDEIAVDHDANIFRILVEPGEALAFGLRADGEEGEFLVFQVFLLLEKGHEAQPRPQGGEQAQRFDMKVAAFDRQRLAIARRDDVVETRRKRHENALVARADPELGEGVVLPLADRLQPIGAREPEWRLAHRRIL